MSKWLALGAGVAGMLVVALVVTVPFLTEERDMPAAIPQPPPLYATATVGLPPGKDACLKDAGIDEHSAIGLFRVGTRKKKGVPLSVTVQGAGYRQVARIPGAYGDNETLTAPIEPPGDDRPVSICIRNEGRREVDLYASADIIQAPILTFIDGKRVESNVTFAFHERIHVSLQYRRGALAERTARFRPVGPDLVLALALLVVVFVPLALVAAMTLSARRRSDA